MRLNNRLRIIATSAVLAMGVVPAAADAAAIGGGGSDSQLPAHRVLATPTRPGSTDWALIALAGGGTAVLVGAGVGGSRRITRRRESAAHVA